MRGIPASSKHSDAQTDKGIFNQKGFPNRGLQNDLLELVAMKPFQHVRTKQSVANRIKFVEVGNGRTWGQHRAPE